MKVVFFAWIVSALVGITNGNDGDPFTLINPVQTECEYQALMVGSRLSDSFNSYDEEVPFYQRFRHDYQKRIGSFHRMAMIEMEKRHLNHYLRENDLQVRLLFTTVFFCFADCFVLERGKDS